MSRCCCEHCAGDPAVLQQAAATQLLMAQAPVPVKMLMGQGVLERLLDLTTQLAVRSSPASAQGSLQVPAICIDLATGKLSLRSTGQRPKDQPALLVSCSSLASKPTHMPPVWIATREPIELSILYSKYDVGCVVAAGLGVM
jgi:hypothetical protein